VIGPALAGVESRVPSMSWLHDWVHNSAKVIASGDEYGNKIYLEYNKSQMTPFTSLKDADIDNIIAYVTAEAAKPKVADDGGGQKDPKQPPGIPQEYLYAILGGMVLILILLLAVLGIITSALKKFLDQRQLTEQDQQIVNSPYSAKGFLSSPGFIFLVVFVVAGISFKTVIDGLYSVGVQQGYQPRQPIAFSHKIHAGQFEIDCKYCHTGAMKGKQAGRHTFSQYLYELPFADPYGNQHRRRRDCKDLFCCWIRSRYINIHWQNPADRVGPYTQPSRPGVLQSLPARERGRRGMSDLSWSDPGNGSGEAICNSHHGLVYRLSPQDRCEHQRQCLLRQARTTAQGQQDENEGGGYWRSRVRKMPLLILEPALNIVHSTTT